MVEIRKFPSAILSEASYLALSLLYLSLSLSLFTWIWPLDQLWAFCNMACSAKDWTPQRSKAISSELQLPRPKIPPSPFTLSLYFFLDPPFTDPPWSGWLQCIWPQQKKAFVYMEWPWAVWKQPNAVRRRACSAELGVLACVGVLTHDPMTHSLRFHH